MASNRYDCIIVGGGPAGLTAALYLERAGKRAAVVEYQTFGGQITASDRVENYPGARSVSGMELADTMFTQAEELGAEMIFSKVLRVERDAEGFRVDTEDGVLFSRTVIAAAGARHRSLGLPNEDRLVGKGISYCAVCDGAFYKDATVAVVGGGNSALQAASYLSALASQVYLIHRRSTFRAQHALIERIDSLSNIVPVLNRRPVEWLDDGTRLIGIRLEDTLTGERTQLSVAAVFLSIGQISQNEYAPPLVSLDEEGYYIAREDCLTQMAGYFVAGDCRHKVLRQLTTAVADGAVAASNAIRYLELCPDFTDNR